MAGESRLWDHPLVIDAGLTPEHLLRDYFSKLSLEDLQTMQAI